MIYNFQYSTCLTYILNLANSDDQRLKFSYSSFFHRFLNVPYILSLFSRSYLAVKPLLFLSFSISCQALSAYATNIIQGNAPYLTFDSGQTRVTNTNYLLSISLSDGRKYTANNNSSIKPITLPNLGETLANVNMYIPIDNDSISLNSVIGSPYNFWGRW